MALIKGYYTMSNFNSANREVTFSTELKSVADVDYAIKQLSNIRKLFVTAKKPEPSTPAPTKASD